MKTNYFTGKGPRKAPLSPLGPTGPTFYDLRPGDRVEVVGSGRIGTLISRKKVARDGWLVRWDEPVFGVTEGRVSWSNLKPKEEGQ